MNYEQALEYIHGAGRFSSCADLCRINALVDELKPELSGIGFIHIAGTNGKGSTAAMIESILRSGGYRVGLFTSPYLVDFCERIQLDRKNIPHDRLADITETVKGAVEKCVARGVEKPNEFEIVTAIALMYYSEEKCDFVVWETGLGGAKDATNVIAPPLAAVITSISFDHVKQLGSTLTLIAGEKSGIIKPGTGFAVCAVNGDEAVAVIKQRCAETGTQLSICTVSGKTSCALGETAFTRNGIEYSLPLTGKFQRENAEAAITVAEKLMEHGVKLSPENIVDGLKNTVWRGRMEIISRNPFVVLDSAHNFGGFEALISGIKELAPGKKPVALTCMMGDKDYEKCLTMLGKLCSRVYVTSVPQARCLDLKSMEKVLSECGCEVIFGGDVKTALKTAVESIADDELLLICGSVYLAGEVCSLATN